MNDSFYQRLVRLRTEHGLSQEQLSAELGVSRQAISKWERGEATPDTNNLIALAEVYDLSLDELVHGSGEAHVDAVVEAELPEEPEPEPETEAESEPEPEPEPVPEPELATEPESEPEPAPEPEPDAIPEPSPISEPDPQPGARDENPFASDAYASYEDTTSDEDRFSFKTFASQELLYPAVCMVAFMTLGICFGLWHPGWLVFLTLPFYYLVGKPIETGRSLGFAGYPMLVTCVYLLLGACFGLWHPGWILFLTIPFYMLPDVRKHAPNTMEGVGALAVGMVALVVVMSMVSWTNNLTRRVLGFAGCTRQVASGEAAEVEHVDASSVKGISIDWRAGSATIRVVDDKELDGQVEISESPRDGWRNTPHMTIRDDSGTLVIAYGDMGSSLASCSASTHGKDLVVTLPKSCAERLGVVTLDGSSGNYELHDVTCKNVWVDLGSGSFVARGVETSDLDVVLGSGLVDIDGKVTSNVRISSSSGDTTIRSSAAPKDVVIDVSSGNVEMLLPKDTGFTADVDVSSGSFTTDFETSQRNDKIIAGDGSMDLEVVISSGKVHVGKL